MIMSQIADTLHMWTFKDQRCACVQSFQILIIYKDFAATKANKHTAKGISFITLRYWTNQA